MKEKSIQHHIVNLKRKLIYVSNIRINDENESDLQYNITHDQLLADSEST